MKPSFLFSAVICVASIASAAETLLDGTYYNNQNPMCETQVTTVKETGDRSVTNKCDDQSETLVMKKTPHGTYVASKSIQLTEDDIEQCRPVEQKRFCQAMRGFMYDDEGNLLQRAGDTAKYNVYLSVLGLDRFGLETSVRYVRDGKETGEQGIGGVRIYKLNDRGPNIFP